MEPSLLLERTQADHVMSPVLIAVDLDGASIVQPQRFGRGLSPLDFILRLLIFELTVVLIPARHR